MIVTTNLISCPLAAVTRVTGEVEGPGEPTTRDPKAEEDGRRREAREAGGRAFWIG